MSSPVLNWDWMIAALVVGYLLGLLIGDLTPARPFFLTGTWWQRIKLCRGLRWFT